MKEKQKRKYENRNESFAFLGKAYKIEKIMRKFVKTANNTIVQSMQIFRLYIQ